MYAIRHKRTKMWVYGTDYRPLPYRQKTSSVNALTYRTYALARVDFASRMCGQEYEIVRVRIVEDGDV